MKPGVNPYTVLGIERGCTEKEIQKAYRLQCLKWHPDKNLDRKEEAERRFIEAKEAFEFLFDKTKREEYDRSAERVRVAEEKHRERMEKADGARRKFIDDLEKREKAFAESLKRPNGGAPLNPAQEAKKRKMEELRIREEMEEIRKQLEKEANEEVKRQMERVQKAHSTHKEKIDENVTPKLMVKWKATSDEDYDEAALKIIFEPYGKIANISSIIVKKQRRKCIIEFVHGENAWGAETETGISSELEISAEWIDPPSKPASNNPIIDYDGMSLEDLEASIL
ncbi:unnamed protein product [Caenorhabditis bovis]|uniref:J domain-containing protein n=1 Tax=Caenorhabditis bovis TaxID=2654633 RepID=A0A8S1EAU0_9PELO|nr:unnamed protein product [Caenorhabditis bovis]